MIKKSHNIDVHAKPPTRAFNNKRIKGTQRSNMNDQMIKRQLGHYYFISLYALNVTEGYLT